MPRSRLYWVCMIGYQLSYVLALFALTAVMFTENPVVRMIACMAIFGFGAGARVYWERANAEFKRLSLR